MMPILTCLRRFLRARHGVALLEFAFVFPILMLLLLGALEVARAMVITQRVEKVAYALADVTSQYPPASEERLSGEISETELRTNVFPQYERIMGVYADTSKQSMILTSVVRDGATNRIKWQIAGGGTLTRNVSSVVNGFTPSAIGAGVMNQAATFPGDGEVAREMLNTANGENVIIAEVFYQYEPIWTRAVGAVPMTSGEEATIARAKLLTKRMYFRPRNGDLICLPDTFIYSNCVGPTTPGPGPGGGTFTCPTNECPNVRDMWESSPCGPCIPDGTQLRATSSISTCPEFECRNGDLIQTGISNRCVSVASCY